jgi:hypothetical protein
MRKLRPLLPTGVLLAFAAIGAGVWLYATKPSPGVTPENFKRLHQWMRLADAEAILGRQADEVLPDKIHIWTESGWIIRVQLDFHGSDRICVGYLMTDPTVRISRVVDAIEIVPEPLHVRLRR